MNETGEHGFNPERVPQPLEVERLHASVVDAFNQADYAVAHDEVVRSGILRRCNLVGR